MKRNNRLFFITIAILLLISTLVGCDIPGLGSNNENQTQVETSTEVQTNPAETSTEEQTNPSTATLKINGINITEYTIVISKKESTGSAEAATYLKEKLTTQYGVKLTTSTAIKDRYEIAIGTNENDSTIISEYEKNGPEYIGVSGKKVFLLGVNYSSLCKVVDAFLEKASGQTTKEINISKGENISVIKDSMKVMSYNLQEDLSKAGRPSDALSRMVSTIQTENPDIFGTQEDTSDIRSYFKTNMTQYECYIGSEGNSIYYKKDKFSVLKKGYYYLSDTPGAKSKYSGSNQYRAFSYIFFEVKETKSQFIFICTHPDYKAVESVRVQQANALSNQLAVINKDNLPVVMVGDFNATPDADSICTYLNKIPNLVNTAKVAKKTGDTNGTLVVSEFTTRQTYVFDYVFVTADTIYTKYFTTIANVQGGKYASDHLPVVAEIDLY